MRSPFSGQAESRSPYLVLTCSFLAWKAVLLLIAVCTPGIGYDTSTDLFLKSNSSLTANDGALDAATRSSTWLASKLVRWDALYFVAAAQRGQLYEQEWAFGWGLSNFIRLISRLLPNALDATLKHSISAIVIANGSHLISVFILFELCRCLQLDRSTGSRSSVLAACLHILSPAGVFLSAPYGESLFSALSFGGYLAYANSFAKSPTDFAVGSGSSHLYLLLSGAAFGASCTIRSNGLFNGFLYLIDLIRLLRQMGQQGITMARLRTGILLTAAGLLVALGFGFPQYIAWTEYCKPGFHTVESRPWCTALIPSVYTFVQEHYWNVGFLRYWTLSNVPLFLLAIPQLFVNFQSVRWAIQVQDQRSEKNASNSTITGGMLRRLAIPQLVVTVLAVTNFHIQIITRISSAYPLTCIWISSVLSASQRDRPTRTKPVILWMVMYALIQGSLYASFLPPA